MASLRQLLRIAGFAGVPAALVACTALTGAGDLRATQSVTRDGGRGGDDDDDDDPTGDDDDDDGGTISPEGGTVISHGPFCSTLNPAPIACYDFEIAASDLVQEISSGGAIALEPEGDGKVMAASIANDTGWAYTWKDLATPSGVELSFDVDLSGLTTDLVDFVEVSMGYGDQEFRCGVAPSTQNGRFKISEFCGGAGPPSGKTALDIPHDVGEFQAGPGFHHIEARFDFAAHSLAAKMRRPDGTEGALAAGTALNATITPAQTFIDIGIPFATTTVAQKVRIDNVIVKTF